MWIGLTFMDLGSGVPGAEQLWARGMCRVWAQTVCRFGAKARGRGRQRELGALCAGAEVGLTLEKVCSGTL